MDVFISYSQQDLAHAADMAERLRALGLEVFYDVDVGGGERFDQIVNEMVQSSRIVMVLWTPRSAQSGWVTAECMAAYERKTLLPVWIEKCSLQTPFNALNTIDLSKWDGEAEHRNWRKVLSQLTKRTGRLAIAELADLNAQVDALGALPHSQRTNTAISTVDEKIATIRFKHPDRDDALNKRLEAIEERVIDLRIEVLREQSWGRIRGNISALKYVWHDLVATHLHNVVSELSEWEKAHPDDSRAKTMSDTRKIFASELGVSLASRLDRTLFTAREEAQSFRKLLNDIEALPEDVREPLKRSPLPTAIERAQRGASARVSSVISANWRGLRTRSKVLLSLGVPTLAIATIASAISLAQADLVERHERARIAAAQTADEIARLRDSIRPGQGEILLNAREYKLAGERFAASVAQPGTEALEYFVNTWPESQFADIARRHAHERAALASVHDEIWRAAELEDPLAQQLFITLYPEDPKTAALAARFSAIARAAYAEVAQDDIRALSAYAERYWIAAQVSEAENRIRELRLEDPTLSIDAFRELLAAHPELKLFVHQLSERVYSTMGAASRDELDDFAARFVDTPEAHAAAERVRAFDQAATVQEARRRLEDPDTPSSEVPPLLTRFPELEDDGAVQAAAAARLRNERLADAVAQAEESGQTWKLQDCVLDSDAAVSEACREALRTYRMDQIAAHIDGGEIEQGIYEWRRLDDPAPTLTTQLATLAFEAFVNGEFDVEQFNYESGEVLPFDMVPANVQRRIVRDLAPTGYELDAFVSAPFGPPPELPLAPETLDAFAEDAYKLIADMGIACINLLGDRSTFDPIENNSMNDRDIDCLQSEERFRSLASSQFFTEDAMGNFSGFNYFISALKWNLRELDPETWITGAARSVDDRYCNNPSPVPVTDAAWDERASEHLGIARHNQDGEVVKRTFFVSARVNEPDEFLYREPSRTSERIDQLGQSAVAVAKLGTYFDASSQWPLLDVNFDLVPGGVYSGSWRIVVKHTGVVGWAPSSSIEDRNWYGKRWCFSQDENDGSWSIEAYEWTAF